MPRHLARILCCAVLCAEFAGVTAPLLAQERPIALDTIRATVASRAAVDPEGATRAVQVITAEEISRIAARDVADVLRWMSGVDLMPRSPASADLSIRGSSFEQVVVLVDGVRVNDPQTGHFHLNLTVPLSQVERIEVLRGAASMLHGSGAIGGVVNIVTRRDGGSALRLEGGSFRSTAAGMDHSQRLGSVDADVAGEVRRSDGHREGTDYELAIARFRLAGPIGPGEWRADVGGAGRNFGADRFYADYPSYEETRTLTSSLAWRGTVGRATVVEPRFEYRRNTDDFILIRERPAVYRNEHVTETFGTGVGIARSLGSRVGLATGLEAASDRLRSATLGDRSESRASLLSEASFGRTGEWIVTAGARGDWYEGHGTYWSPSAAIAWWPAPVAQIHASVGRALRAPTWTERYYRDPGNIGDPTLRPERALGTEAGVRVYPIEQIRAGLVAFTRRSENLIDWARPVASSTEPWRTRNVREARFDGLEADLEVAGPGGVHWKANASWMNVTDTGGAFESKYALRPVVESVGIAATREFGGALLAEARGKRTRRSGDPLGAHTVLDLRVRSMAARPLALVVDVRNLAGAQYIDIIGAPGPGRAISLSAEWRPGR